MGDRPAPRPARTANGRFVKGADGIDGGPRPDPLAEIAAEMTGEIAGLRAYIEARETERHRPAKPDTAESLAVWYRAIAVMVVALIVIVGVVATAYLLRPGG